jgi:hypothetical protein
VASGLAAGLDILLLVYGASSVFHQLQNSLNALWNLTPRGETITRSILYVATMRLMSALIVLVLGLMLIVLVMANTIESTLAFKPIEWLNRTLDVPLTYWRWVIAPLAYLLVFILMFKCLPKAAIRWRDVLPGAFVTSTPNFGPEHATVPCPGSASQPLRMPWARSIQRSRPVSRASAVSDKTSIMLPGPSSRPTSSRSCLSPGIRRPAS